MAIAKSTSVTALARLRAERAAFDKREREARREAAIELGEAVLKSADLALESAQVGQLIQAVMTHGFDASMAMLMPPAVAAASSRKVTPLPGQPRASDDVAG